MKGARLAAPSLLGNELANMRLVKIRRAPSREERLRAAYGMAHRLRVETVAVDYIGILELAEAAGLTAYDASYLWVAHSMGAELVTLDRKLAAAAT